MLRIIAPLANGRIALAMGDGRIELWGAFSGERIGRLPALLDHRQWDPEEDPRMIHAVLALTDGRLAAGEHDGSIRLWDVPRRRVAATLTGHARQVCSLALLPDGRLVSGSRDQTIRIWDIASAREIACIKTVHIGPIDQLISLPNERLASGCFSCSGMMVWDLRTLARIDDIDTPSATLGAFTGLPDGRIALGYHDHSIVLIDPDTQRMTRLKSGHTGVIWGLCPLPNARLASTSNDQTIRVWDLATGGEIACHQLDFAAGDIALHTDGRIVAASSWDSRLCLLQV